MAEEKVEQLIQAARDAGTFGHSNSGNCCLIRHYIEMIRFLDTQTDRLLKQIRQSLNEQPDSLLNHQVKLIQTIPGAGFLTAVTLACVGVRTERASFKCSNRSLRDASSSAIIM